MPTQFQRQTGSSPASSQPEEASASREMVTKSFSLYAEDVRRIRQVNEEDELRSESAALRQLLRDGWRWRELRQKAEARLLAGVHEDGAGAVDGAGAAGVSAPRP